MIATRRTNPQSGGKTPEKDWLTGDALGWRAWGTTYAPNLCLSIPKMSETEWVKKAKTLQTRPRCRGSTCTA